LLIGLRLLQGSFSHPKQSGGDGFSGSGCADGSQHYPLPPSNFIRKCPKTQGNMSTAMEMAVKNAIIYPESVEFEKLLEDKPGLFIQLFNKLYENVGLGENFSVIEGK